MTSDDGWIQTVAFLSVVLMLGVILAFNLR